MSYVNRGDREGRYGSGGRGGFTEGRRFGGERRMDGPRPVEAGKEYSVEITELSRRGDGVAKIQGFVIFVRGGRVGDRVKIRIESVGPRFATASVVESAPATTSSTPTSAPIVDEVKSGTQ
jgi:predicted RNA-binding protein with TRAM domain